MTIPKRFKVKKNEKPLWKQIRKPIAPPSKVHKDKKKYNRKEKHKKKWEEVVEW